MTTGHLSAVVSASFYSIKNKSRKNCETEKADKSFEGGFFLIQFFFSCMWNIPYYVLAYESGNLKQEKKATKGKVEVVLYARSYFVIANRKLKISLFLRCQTQDTKTLMSNKFVSHDVFNLYLFLQPNFRYWSFCHFFFMFSIDFFRI